MSSTTEQLQLGRLKDKVAIVTGGASALGFGAAISKRFVSEGARVIIGDLDESGAASVARDLGSPNVKGVKMNVCMEEDWKRVVDMAVKEFGRLDIVVNNAGTTYRNKPTAEVTEDEFERVYQVNVKSIFWSVKVAIAQMQKQGQGGSMINISSSGSVRPRPGLVWYNASKGAVSNVSILLGVGLVMGMEADVLGRRLWRWLQSTETIRSESMRLRLCSLPLDCSSHL